MKKRIVSILLALLMVLSLMPASAFADTVASGTCGSNAMWTLDEQGHLSITGTGDMDDYNTGIIYGTGEVVDKEPCPWKDRMSDITGVTIGEGITSVGYEAFAKALNLKFVDLPSTMKTINNFAFEHCRALKEVVIPDSCEKIGANAFYACTSLERVVIGSGVKDIGAEVFNWAPLKGFELSAGNTSFVIKDGALLTRDEKELIAYPGACACDVYTVPSTVDTIPLSFFEGVANGPREVVIPSSVTTIRTCAFEYMDSLERITIPASVTDFGNGSTFYGCSNLKEIVMLADVNTVPYGFAAQCDSLEAVTLPDSVTAINEGAFNYCTSLSEINVPQNLKSIGRLAFTGCGTLTEFPFPESLTYIGDHAFYLSGITEMPAWLTETKEGSYAIMSQLEFSVTHNQTKARNMLSLINDMRTGGDAWIRNKYGENQMLGVLGALTYDYDLEQIAMQRANEIAVYFSHTRPNGDSCFTVTSNGTSSYGENICVGTNTTEGAFDLWCETDQPYSGQGHRRNMLDAEWTAVGIASVTVHGVTYWVQEFSTDNSGAATTPAADSTETATVGFVEGAVADAKISLSENSITLDNGTSAALPAAAVKVLLTEGWRSDYEKCSTEPAWSSSDTSVARIENGEVIALKCGNATLTASAFNTSAEVTVSVLHTWDDGRATTEPTETADGTMTFTCAGCGATREEVIPKLPHNHRFVDGKCEVCGCMLGDVNNDGKVNQKDVARLRQYLADSVNYPMDAPQNADVNKDGKINQKDVARLRQFLADSAAYPLG